MLSPANDEENILRAQFCKKERNGVYNVLATDCCQEKKKKKTI